MFAFRKPILCEKPFTDDLGELSRFLDWAGKSQVNLQMVNQYRYIPHLGANALTYYDYYHSGTDGLAWDCISLIALARGSIMLHNRSPVWECIINGQHLSLRAVQEAYVEMLVHWLATPKQDLKYIYDAHRKVKDYVDGQEDSTNRDSG
jgi:hypothetical protein